jgi:uncharacterized protein YciI
LIIPERNQGQFIYQFEAIWPELVTYADAWTDEDNRIAEAHYAYLKEATEAGVILLAGRSLDGLGPTVAIFKAESDEAPHQFVENGPFVSGGLLRSHLHPFRAAQVRRPC